MRPLLNPSLYQRGSNPYQSTFSPHAEGDIPTKALPERDLRPALTSLFPSFTKFLHQRILTIKNSRVIEAQQHL
jgi:hypothetical protein